MTSAIEPSTESTALSAATAKYWHETWHWDQNPNQPKLRLNLGCGPLRLENEIGIDKFAGPAVDVVADILNLPYPDESAEFVRMDHVLEHLESRLAVRALLEAKRVLMPGGAIRVGVPDFKASCREYLEKHRLGEKALIMRWFYGSQAHEGEYHKSGWDKESLADLLTSCGFQGVVVADDTARDTGICIFAEAVKP